MDFISGYARQEIGSIGESLAVPATYIMTTMVMPLTLIPRLKNENFSFAVGQFMLCRTNAFRSIGGYSSIRKLITDDINLAKTLKKHGYKTIFLDAKKYVSCRMYMNYRDSFIGLSRSIFSALDKNLLSTGLLVVLLLLVIEFPFLNLMLLILFMARISSSRLFLSLRSQPAG